MHGILPLWKPKGMTSHDCVNRLRRILGTKKVGHTGTLDPDVEGVLPMCIGMATKLASYVTESAKTYEAEVYLGKATETEDREGAVIEEAQVSTELTIEHVRNVLDEFTGPITQIPPLYSAVRVNGKRLYEYAREGIEVERPAREVTISSIELMEERLSYTDDGGVTFPIRITCSKGTYIRTLCVDIGRALGYPAHMSNLVRTASGSFVQEEALTFDAIERFAELGEVERHLEPLERGMRHYSRVTVKPDHEEKVYHGSVFPVPKQLPKTNPFCMMSEDGRMLAIYQIHPTKPNLIKPVRVFQYE
ncbi:tRNA pseudouridine synthase B [Pontibacillus halophilus JSM 076056 = DSM 19796]|uniref:tRNA pseudouridine synthase B n=1 Tax=Pontibacillus halophilus JSM 076056 = DSM 19796 TaxID=1385510 RepID=A0A0A5GMD0_9BACI|nr:tRNA pseudouridine(55) synthase TruB [Pontibacillus halophilus]KGX93129.1 tRNA pseudouridine synthase B [Pontibacillus halophilus JSM 076056 = DSM 19796]